MRYLSVVIGVLALFSLILPGFSQDASSPVPNSYPHDYPGKPRGDYSPAWQNCESSCFLFTCHTEGLLH